MIIRLKLGSIALTVPQGDCLTNGQFRGFDIAQCEAVTPKSSSADLMIVLVRVRDSYVTRLTMTILTHLKNDFEWFTLHVHNVSIFWFDRRHFYPRVRMHEEVAKEIRIARPIFLGLLHNRWRKIKCTKKQWTNKQGGNWGNNIDKRVRIPCSKSLS